MPCTRFKESVFNQNLTYLAIQRYMVYLLHSTPLVLNTTRRYYNGIQADAWTAYEEHVVSTSRQLVTMMHTKCKSIFELCRLDADLQYSGPKIPKNVDSVNAKNGMRVRDVETELITYDLCKDGLYIRSEECVAVTTAVSQGMPIKTVLLSMLPVSHPQRSAWEAMSKIATEALMLQKKRKSLAMMQSLHKQYDKRLVARMVLLVRSCVIALTQVWKRVKLPLAEHLAQIVSLHGRLGQPAPCKPRLGALPPAHVSSEDTPQHCAARVLQRVARQILVAQYWRIELRAFWCKCCGETQLPPRQRCLYTQDENGKWRVMCGLSRKFKRADYDRASKTTPRRRNDDKKCRHEMLGSMCEQTECESINLIGTALVNDTSMIMTCTKCASVSQVDPLVWTSGHLFVCTACFMQSKRIIETPRCLKCSRSGYRHLRSSFEKLPWAEQPITYLDANKQLQTGLICDSCDGRWYPW